MALMRTILGFMICLILGACAGQSASNGIKPAPSGLFQGLPALPTTGRTASGTTDIPGTDTHDRSTAATVEDTSLNLYSTEAEYTWAVYGYQASLTETVTGAQIDVTVEDGGEYWLGFSDYAFYDTWEWHGPYTDDQGFDFNTAVKNYKNDSNAMYWAVVAMSGNRVTVVSTQIESTGPTVAVPPGGEHSIEDKGSSPSLAMHPGHREGSVAGAPLIAHAGIDGATSHVYLSYYDGSAWQQLSILEGPGISSPSLLWTESGGILFAYNPVASTINEYHLNEFFSITDEQTAFSLPSGYVLSDYRICHNSDYSQLGIVSSLTGTDSQQVFFCHRTTDSAWATDPVIYTGTDTIGGISAAINPDTGNPELVYTHGTIDTEGGVIFDFTMDYGVFNGSDWSIDAIGYPDSPLRVDLIIESDGTARLVFSANRTWSFNFPPFISISQDIYFDSVAGTRDGSGDWSFETVFESVVTPSYSPPSTVVIELEAAPQPVWARLDEVCYMKMDGSFDYDVAEETITNGSLTNHVQYSVYGGGGFGDTNYFNGTDGVSFSWAELGGNHACAYVKGESIDMSILLAGGLDLSSEILYWQK